MLAENGYLFSPRSLERSVDLGQVPRLPVGRARAGPGSSFLPYLPLTAHNGLPASVTHPTDPYLMCQTLSRTTTDGVLGSVGECMVTRSPQCTR